MTFEEDYFTGRNYSGKEALVKRHVIEVLKWASEKTGVNLFLGEDKKALDVGCALGYTSQVLSGFGYDTIGFDISSWGTRQAKPDVCKEFLVCDAQGKMPFVEQTFDLVTCFDVLEHLPYPEMALRGMSEVSKGVVVCTTPNSKVEKPIRKLMGDYDPTHISTKPPSEWQRHANVNMSGSVRVESFYDIALRVGGKLFFKSISIPTYGLTVRIVVKR